MKAKLPRLTLSKSVPGADKFNRWLDDILDVVESIKNITGSGIAAVTSKPTGVHIHVPDFPIAIVKTTGTISARSGATPGFGNVTFQMFNLTSFTDDPARTNLKVYNYSSNSTLTVSGKYGVCIKWFGVWWLIVCEC